MKKLLIVSGCSYTDPFYRAYVNNNVNVWPSIVAKELEVDLINFAGEGCSNDWIANSIMDGVLDNLERDIITMALWTEGYRCIPKNGYGPKRLFKEQWIVEYQLRCMWRLNEFLKQRKIPIYQGHALSIPAGNWKQLNIEVGCENTHFAKNKYFNSEYFGPQKFEDNMMWVANDKYSIPEDGHPNQKAHNWIANYFLTKYRGQIHDPVPENKEYVEFIYE